MTVVVNGEPRSLPAGASVDDVVTALGCSPSGIAVALNGEVVPRSTWPDVALAADDRVEVLTAAQGG
jgi:sulfur carrier protein